MFLPLFCLLLAQAPAANDLETPVKTVVEAFAVVQQEAADPVPPDRAFYGGVIPGMLRRLDPHSVFFDPDQFEQLKQLQKSTQKGFGSIVSVLPGRVIVLQTMPGTPSAKSGIASGDEILAVNDYELARFEMEQIVAILSQSRQQPAKIDVRRPGSARILQFSLTPEELQSPSVERTFHLKPGIGYLRVSSFDEKTGEQVREAIQKLGGPDLKGLVLDLRNNPGGVMGAALETAALFLKPGSRLLTVRGRAVEEKEEKVPPGAKPYEFPVSVLINGKSASASEIVAGALQDHDRGAVVGEPSFGKGLVESVYPLSEGTGMALTTALYYTPSGRSIQRPLANSGFGLAATSARLNTKQDFQTAAGRVVRGGGGIQPDYIVFPEPVTRLRAVLDGSGSFTNFATEYVRKHKITGSFEVAPAALDEFRAFLFERRIQPGVSEWSSELNFIRNRLKTEIFNQALSVEKGDEVEAERDPQIQKAVDVLGQQLK
jgi:carboxyl-terminal processing protease